MLREQTALVLPVARGFESQPYESIVNSSAQFDSAYFSLAKAMKLSRAPFLRGGGWIAG
jgi:hypothetical protein